MRGFLLVRAVLICALCLSTARPLLARGYSAFDDPQATIKQMTVRLHKDSNDWKAYTIRGACNLQLRKGELAEADLRKALKLAPENWEVYRWLSPVLLFGSKNEEALAIAEVGLKIAPEKGTLKGCKAEALVALKKYDEAISFLDNFEENSPKDADLFYFRGTAKKLSGKYDKRSYRSDFAKAVSLKPENTEFNSALLQAK